MTYPSTSTNGAGIEIVPAALIGAAGTMNAEAHSIEYAIGALQARLTSVGACWGKDVVGRRFGADYQPVAEQVIENIGAMAVGLVRIGAALRAVAQKYDAVDDQVRRAVTTTNDTMVIS